jgi:hypothetical protein
MRCKGCSATLNYHTAGMTCRNCGFSVDHELLVQERCVSCDHFLEESEKAADICVSCQYDLVKGNFDPNNFRNSLVCGERYQQQGALSRVFLKD